MFGVAGVRLPAVALDSAYTRSGRSRPRGRIGSSEQEDATLMNGMYPILSRARAALPALPALVILAAAALLAALHVPSAAQAAPAASRHEGVAGSAAAAPTSGEPAGCDAPWSYGSRWTTRTARGWLRRE